MIRALVLGLRFCLEIGTLLVLGYWGYHISTVPFLRWSLAIALPLSAAAVWSIFGSPGSRVKSRPVVKLGLGTSIFGLTTIGLFATSHPYLAIGFAVVVTLDTLLLVKLKI